MGTWDVGRGFIASMATAVQGFKRNRQFFVMSVSQEV